jgi:hypothetical protein
MDISQTLKNNQLSAHPDLAISQIAWPSLCLRISGAGVFLCGIATALVAGWLIIIGYSPTPFADHWGIFYDLSQGKHWYSPAWLWSQSNEHRIPIVRLMAVADLKLASGHSILLFATIFTTLALHWSGWAIFIRKTTPISTFVCLSVVGFFAFCIFCPTQVENFYWALQLTFVSSFFFSSISFICLVWLSSQHRPWSAIILSCAAAFMAESTLASGFFTWPVLWVGARYLAFKRKHIAALVGISLACSFAYVYHYQTPKVHSNPLMSMRQPGRVAQYLFEYIGHPFSAFVLYPRVLGFALSLAAIVCLRFLLKRCETRTLALALGMNMCFIVLTGLITALGRLRFGILEADASRYQTPVMLYWACAFTALLLVAAQLRSWQHVLALNVLALAGMLLPLHNLIPLAEGVRNRASRLNSAGESLDYGVIDPPSQYWLSAGMFAVEPATIYLHSLGKKVMPESLRFPHDTIPSNQWDAGACDGGVDALTELTRFYPGPPVYRADGWAVNRRTHKAVSAIAVVGDNEKVLSVTTQQLPYPDVLPPRPQPHNALGWRVYTSVPEHVTRLRAIALVHGNVCPISNVLPTNASFSHRS